MVATPTVRSVGRLDIVLLVLILILTTLGILLVFDASYPFALAHKISQTRFLSLQAMWGLGGIVGLLVASRVPFWKWRTIANSGVLLSIILLGLVLIPHVGIVVNGARRWLGHGSFRIQPSEFAKLFLILYVARSCAGRPRIMRHFLIGPGPGILATVIIALLIAKQPDLGTSLLVAGTGIAMLFFAGMKRLHLTIIVAVVAVVVGGYFVIKAGHGQSSYQLSRIFVFLNPEKYKQGDGFQVYHSTLALGTGGLTGEGIGQGREKLDLPEAYTDFIFAVVGEEGGLFASLSVLLLYCFIVARGMHIACNTNDRFGALVAAGISFSIGLQALVNIGGVTASIPQTGVPLPGISYGGSSLLLTLLMSGILLNVGRFPDGNPDAARDTATKAEREFYKRWPRTGDGHSDQSDERLTRKSRSPIRTTI